MAGLARWDPFREFLGMEREMGRLFSDLAVLPPLRREGGAMVLAPSIDVYNRDEDLVIRAEMPGIKPDDVDISIVDDVLTLHGKRAEKLETKEEDYLIRESSWGEFERTLRLPAGVKPDSVHAEYTDGVLEIVVPHGARAETTSTVHVPIETKTPEPSKLEAHH